MVSGILKGAAGAAAVTIVIQAVDRYSKELKKVDKSVKKQQGIFKKLTGFVKSTGIGYAVAAGAAVGFAVESVKAAIEAERAFQQFNLVLGDTADLMLNDLRKASKGLVSDFDLVNDANKALALGISKNKLPQLLEVAAARAKVFGRTTGEAFNDLAIGIGRQSRLILDNLGIILDLDKAHTEYAESIGKTSDSLTELEKKEALVNAILKESQGLLAAQPFLLETNAEKLQRLSAGWDNFKTSAGTAIIDLGPSLRDEMSKQLDVFDVYEQEATGFSKSMDVRAIAITDLSNEARTAAEQLKGIENFFKGITDVKLLGESEKDLEIAEKTAEINKESLKLSREGKDFESFALIKLREELEELELERKVEFDDVKNIQKAKGDAFIAEKRGLELNKDAFLKTIEEKLGGWDLEIEKIQEVDKEVSILIDSYNEAATARSGAGIFGTIATAVGGTIKSISDLGRSPLPSFAPQQGRSSNQNNIIIENIFGLSAENVSQALSEELNNKVSL